MRSRERGEGKLGVIIFIVIVALVIFLAVKLVPPRINAYELKDYIQDMCLRGPYEQRMTPESMKKEIVEKASELNLPLTEDEIEVTKSGGNVVISCVVEVPIDLKVTTYTLKVDCSSKSKKV